jgi:hypothetical protein
MMTCSVVEERAVSDVPTLPTAQGPQSWWQEVRSVTTESDQYWWTGIGDVDMQWRHGFVWPALATQSHSVARRGQ